MIKNEFLIASMLVFSCSAIAGLNKDKSQDVPGFKLQLEQESYLTDKNGVAIPEQIIRLKVGKTVRIYRPDGFCYGGEVTEIEEAEGLFKVYGNVLNAEGVRFGFALAKGGKFAGAIIDKANDTVYVLEFSAEHKGFILRRSYKYDKATS